MSAVSPAAAGRAGPQEVEAARLLLARLGVSPADLLGSAAPWREVPTFAMPRRLPSTRRAVPGTRLAEINHVAATTGNDPALDALLLRLHTETACRRGGALALRPADLDPTSALSSCGRRARPCGGSRSRPPSCCTCRPTPPTGTPPPRAAAALPGRAGDHLPPV